MSAPKGLTRADKLDMMARRARGEKLATIATAHGVTVQTVRYHLTHESAPRVLAPCGTLAAHKRHRRRGEQPCLSCMDALNASRRQKRAAA